MVGHLLHSPPNFHLRNQKGQECWCPKCTVHAKGPRMQLKAHPLLQSALRWGGWADDMHHDLYCAGMTFSPCASEAWQFPTWVIWHCHEKIESQPSVHLLFQWWQKSSMISVIGNNHLWCSGFSVGMKLCTRFSSCADIWSWKRGLLKKDEDTMALRWCTITWVNGLSMNLWTIAGPP